MNNHLKIIITALLFSFSCVAMSPQEAIAKNPQLKGLIESVKQQAYIIDKEKGVVVEAVDPSEDLLQMVYSVLQKCSIIQEVIVLELKKTVTCDAAQEIIPRTGIYAYTDDKKTLSRFLLVTKDGCSCDAECEAMLYHECGHIYYNHPGKLDLVLENMLLHTTFALSSVGYLSLFSEFKISEPKVFFALVLWLSIVKQYSDVFVNRFLIKFYERYRERLADNFAFTHLLQEKNYAAYVAYLKYFVDMHESGKKVQVYGWTCSHPSDYERAKSGLEYLKKHNLSIEALLNDDQVKKLYDEETRSKLLARVKNLYPELV